MAMLRWKNKLKTEEVFAQISFKIAVNPVPDLTSWMLQWITVRQLSSEEHGKLLQGEANYLQRNMQPV